MNLMTVSHSSRVTFPSRFASTGPKKSLSMVHGASSLVIASFSFALACLWMVSHGGSWNSLSSEEPGDQPAKNTAPSIGTGDVQGADGIPATDHFSSPDLTS